MQQQFEPHAWPTAMESRGRPQLQPYTFMSPWIVIPKTSGREQPPLLWWFWLLRLISYLKVAFPSQGLGQEVPPAACTGCLWALILETSTEPPARGSAALRAQGQLRQRVLLGKIQHRELRSNPLLQKNRKNRPLCFSRCIRPSCEQQSLQTEWFLQT